MSNVGKVLKQIRVDSKITQVKLAKKLGYTNGQYISNVERGLCPMSLKKLKRICDILKVPKDQVASALLKDFSEKIAKNGFLNEW